MASSSVYFRNLNGLRFIAASLVVVHHTEHWKAIFGYGSAWGHPAVKAFGSLGVTLFFVLSGFLITYLLLVEKERSGDIHIGHFYMRRILRIWPLYFLMVALGFFVLPHLAWLPDPAGVVADPTVKHLLLYALFLPNVALLLLPPIPYVAILWSIGAEEQFYLIWPLLVRFARRVGVAIAAFLALYLATKLGIAGGLGAGMLQTWPWERVHHFLEMARLDCMAIGGLMAVAMHRGAAWTSRLCFSPATQLGAWLLVALLIDMEPWLDEFYHEAYGVLFAVLIANFALNPRSWVRLEHPVLNHLGKVSYGIYVFHPLMIGVSIALLRGAGIPAAGPLLYVLVFGLVIGVSSLSYELLERRFIAMKGRFTQVRSGTSEPDAGPRAQAA